MSVDAAKGSCMIVVELRMLGNLAEDQDRQCRRPEHRCVPRNTAHAEKCDGGGQHRNVRSECLGTRWGVSPRRACPDGDANDRFNALPSL